MPAILPALIAITIALIVITRPDPLHDPADEGGEIHGFHSTKVDNE